MHASHSRPSGVILVVDDDPAIRNAVASALESGGRRIVTCSDIEAAQLLVETLDVSAIVSDVRLTGPFAFEGLDFIRTATQRRPGTPFVIMTGDENVALHREALHRGATGFLRKPFDIAELEGLLGLTAADDGEGEVVEVPPVESVLHDSLTYAVFHPILPAAADVPAGFECLTRVRTGSPLQNPAFLFRYAERRARLYDLELEAMRNAFAAAPGLPGSPLLFLNVHPHSLAREGFGRNVAAIARESGTPLASVVLEITEQAAITDIEGCMRNVSFLREAGAAFALDDVGVAYSHLLYIERLAPSYVKVSQDFGSGFESDPTRRKIVQNIAALARSFHCRLIVEGIETETTAAAARAIGVDLLQGYLFGRPAPAEEWRRRWPHPDP